MIEGWSVVALALGYVSILFALAWYADRAGRFTQGGRRPAADLCPVAGRLLHVLDVLRQRRPGRLDRLRFHSRSISARSCSSLFGWRFLLRIVRLAKSQNITSVADFLAARYGKSQAVAAIVTVIAVAGTLPYIALQLKAVALSVDTLLGARPLQQLQSADRHGLHHRPGDGDVRRPVRHPPHRCDRAPGRPDRGGRRRVARQARGLPGGRLLRHLLGVRRRRRLPRARRTQSAGDPAHLRARLSTAAPGSR